MTGRGPYPFLIAFCATRDHLVVLNRPHPPDLGYLPTHPISQALSNSFFFNSIHSVEGIESWCALRHENLTNTCPTIYEINFLISFFKSICKNIGWKATFCFNKMSINQNAPCMFHSIFVSQFWHWEEATKIWIIFLFNFIKISHQWNKNTPLKCKFSRKL